MTPAETIAAAIEKLEKLKAESTQAPWHYWTDELTGDVDIWHDQEARTHVAMVGQYGEPRIYRDAELIVTLHRTIDAQLAILRKAHEQVSWYIQRVSNKDESFTYVPPAPRRRRIQKLWGEPLDLARAILAGVTS